jgi:3-isopropylmalate dehydrogenase
LYEPIHGSAPDIAGKGLANPLGMILSVAMMLNYSFELPEEAALIENAVGKALADGYRTGDIYREGPGIRRVGTSEIGDKVRRILLDTT